jgi:hypothetical protein
MVYSGLGRLLDKVMIYSCVDIELLRLMTHLTGKEIDNLVILYPLSQCIESEEVLVRDDRCADGTSVQPSRTIIHVHRNTHHFV